MDCTLCLRKRDTSNRNIEDCYCCGIFPMELEFWNRHQKDLKRPIVVGLALNGPYFTTEDKKCPFLGYDNKCSVYENRPDVCRRYGGKDMPCPWQDEEGNLRKHKETKEIISNQIKNGLYSKKKSLDGVDKEQQGQQQ